MREKIELDIKGDESKYLPQHIKDLLVQIDIDKLLRRPWLPEKEKCSLEPKHSWQNENISQKRKLKAQTKPVNPVRKDLKHTATKISSEEMNRNTKAKTLAELYVAGLLLKMGSEVALMRKGVGYDMLVLTADKKIERLNVVADRNVNSLYVGIETMRVVKGKTVLDIDSTLADHYIIKICGTPGVYQIATNKLKQILKTRSQKRTTRPCDDGHYGVVLIDRELLLANCEGLNL